MDIEEEAKKLEEEAKKFGGNPILRYAPLFVGLVLALISEGCQTWKRSAAEEARGNVAAIEFKIQSLRQRAADTESNDKAKKLREEADEIAEDKLQGAQKEAAKEQVDAQNGVWLLSMLQWVGAVLATLGLVFIATMGSNYEKAGALVAIGFLVTRLF